MRFFSRKRAVWLCILFGIPLMLYLFRVPLFRGMGNFLICEDELQKTGVLFVLGGGSYNRANEAARLYKEGYAEKIVCLGENVPTVFLAMDMRPYTEAEVAGNNLLRLGIDSSSIELLKKGTSTMEEVRIILEYCLKHHLSKAAILTGKFHTRRVRNVCGQVVGGRNIKLTITGAASKLYREEEWWKSEEGMIALNNEYMKLLYYFVKY